MGGYGSGRYTRRNGRRNSVDGYHQLDAQKLWKNGVLVPGNCVMVGWTARQGNPQQNIGVISSVEGIELHYTATDNQGVSQSINTFVRIEPTPCYFGGQRWWFRCPRRQCGRRVRLLYGGRYFLCRQCHGLNYQSQAEPRWERLCHKAQGIRIKLGGTRCLADPFPDKPKGMHWRTYSQLYLKEKEVSEACGREMMKSLHTRW